MRRKAAGISSHGRSESLRTESGRLAMQPTEGDSAKYGDQERQWNGYRLQEDEAD